MLSQEELNHIRRRAEQKQAGWLEKNPGVQTPPDEGSEVLTLVAEVERLSAVTDRAVQSD
jgi:hypothetical protein